jgi:tetratricopeptide (TPR) repeat protein
MTEPFFSRLWNAVKPPPPVYRPGKEPSSHKRRQRRLLLITAGVAALGFAAWGVYAYIASAPQRAQQEFQAGMRFLEPKNYQRAVGSFSRSIDIWPRISDAFYERGIAYRAMGKTDLALADFDKAIELNPNMDRAYASRGLIYRERGDIRGAVEQFTKSINIRATVDAYYQRGQTYESLGEHQKAIEDYDYAIAVLRDAPHVYRARSLAKRNLGDIEGADADREKAKTFERH